MEMVHRLAGVPTCLGGIPFDPPPKSHNRGPLFTSISQKKKGQAGEHTCPEGPSPPDCRA